MRKRQKIAIGRDEIKFRMLSFCLDVGLFGRKMDSFKANVLAPQWL